MRLSWMWGGTCLIAGTAIGAGMLALPEQAAHVGLWPSLTALGITWLAMASTAWIWWLVSRLYPADTQLTALTQNTLGIGVARLTSACYLALLVTLGAAYLSGLSALLHPILPTSMASSVGGVALALWALLSQPTVILDAFNRVLMILMAISFVFLMGMPNLHGALPPVHWEGASSLFPIMVTAFGFHIVIPTLRQYSNDHPKLGQLIVLASSLPAFVYALWITVRLHADAHPPALHAAMTCFQASAMGTSVIGVMKSLLESLIDLPGGQHTQRWQRSGLALIASTLCLWIGKSSFIAWLQYASLFVAYLLIVLPSAMLMAVRKRLESQSVGAAVILAWGAGGFGLWVITLEVMNVIKPHP